MSGQIFHSTIYVDSRGNNMTTNRVFFIHAAVEEIQNNGYLSEQTLHLLSATEYQLVVERATAKDNN